MRTECNYVRTGEVLWPSMRTLRFIVCQSEFGVRDLARSLLETHMDWTVWLPILLIKWKLVLINTLSGHIKLNPN
jgi:hypothetical protein